MTVVTLTFIGVSDELERAKAELAAIVPTSAFVCKTETVFEADLDETQMRAVAVHGQWSIGATTYAEIAPPTLNIAAMRRALCRKR